MESSRRIIERLVEDKSVEQEWKLFEANEPIDPAVSKRMLLAVKRYTVNRLKARRILARASAIAACFVLAIMGIYFLSGDLSKKTVLAENLSKSNIIRNDDNVKKVITLADSSRIVLYGKSALHIDSNFNISSRKMHIEGEADFFVAQNPDKPFVVTADNYSTTALGTSFKVVYRNDNDQFAVRLMTGKVSIESRAGGTNRLLCYLAPGQEVNVNMESQEFVVKKTKSESEKPLKNSAYKSRKKVLPSSTIQVEKESLTSLLHRLSKQFDTVIVFDEDEFNSMSVTATFKNESLEDILEQIAILNELSYERKGSGYLIGKK